MEQLAITARLAIPFAEIHFHFSRSGGPGGQNVNKVSSRVELLFDVRHSQALSEEEKGRILRSLGGRIDNGGVLHVQSQESRSQWKNREVACEKLAELLRGALRTQRKRVPTRVSKGAKERRYGAKKKRGEIKKMRGKVSERE